MKERKPLVIGDLTAKIPVIQGGMGVGVSLSGLAGAVAYEGGIGLISTAQIGYREPDWEDHPVEANLRAVRSEILRAKEISEGRGIVGVNIMVATRFYERYVRAAVEAGAELIVSGAGLPVSLPQYTEGSETKIAPIVSSKKAASVLCRMWEKKYKRLPDLVVIEGPEAGGHLGFSPEELSDLPAMSFEEEVVSIVSYIRELEQKHHQSIPVVLAGGIYDGKDMDHALSLGVDGIQAATRFVTTEECDASEAFKQAYLDVKKEEIQIVKSPVGMPGRAIKNDRTAEYCKPEKCHLCIEKCDRETIPYCITRALIRAVRGEVEQGLVFCGSNAYRAERIETVREVMNSFMS